MAFKAANVLPENGYSRAKERVSALKKYMQSRISQLSTDTNADLVLSIYFDISRGRAELASIAAISGIAQYAKDQENDQTYDVVAEFTALLANLDAITSAVSDGYPRDNNGYLLDRKVVGDTIEFRTFTSGQLASFVSLMQSAVNGIS